MRKFIKESGSLDLIVVLIFLIVSIFFLIRRQRLNQKGIDTYGIVTEQFSGARNHQYIEYTFQVGDLNYKGFIGIPFFKYCNYDCCNVGDTVIVRYEKGNPKNNHLLKSLTKDPSVHTER